MKDMRKYWDEEAGLGPDRSVIDRHDKRGNKIKYITFLRDRAILEALNDISPSARILDFGCGSGNLAKTLDMEGYGTIGVDISLPILKHSHLHKFEQSDLFVQYDGKQLPFSSNSFDACVISGVLCLLNDADLSDNAMQEIYRVLKPGGRLVAVEQTCRKRRYSLNNMKLQRPTTEIMEFIKASGFINRFSRIIRRGHFPLIYPVRYGIICLLFFPLLERIEKLFGKVFKKVLFDYADTVFISDKPLNKELTC